MDAVPSWLRLILCLLSPPLGQSEGADALYGRKHSRLLKARMQISASYMYGVVVHQN